jgi:hypothetical protein
MTKARKRIAEASQTAFVPRVKVEIEPNNAPLKKERIMAVKRRH